MDRLLQALHPTDPQSPNTLARKSGLPRRAVVALCHKDPRIHQFLEPHKIGSHKHPGNTNLWVAPDKDFELI